MRLLRSREAGVALIGILVCSGGAASPQQQPAAAQITDQQIVGVLNGISQRAGRLEPMIQQLHPKDWVAKGAPDTYVEQWNSTLEQLRAVQSDMSALVQHADRMTDGMKALFRVQRTHDALGSLMGGLRKYQNPALADLIESVAAGDANDLERFQQYLLDLANEREQQFALVDGEAQRCRGTILRQPAQPPPANRRAP